MTKQELAKYPNYKKRAEKLKSDIYELETRDIESVSGKVKGSMKEHPYTERRFSVQMEVPGEAEKIHRQIGSKRHELEEIEIKMQAIEEFIGRIQDIHIKTIFEYSFIEGLTQREVGEKVGLDRSRISRKIDNYLKTHTKHTKSMV
ncbi:MAG: hypothetical protein HFJ09_11925 [Lachnospiraceae bacterium]|nr:hypothetical protein [Lachnospiraceae bacterium]